jgi:hypothetical protein
MTVQPDIDVATYLNATLPQLATGDNLFVGPMRPTASASQGGGMPRNAVFCLQLEGRRPQTFMNCSSAGYQWHALRYPNVQISIRRDQYKFEDGRNLGFAIVDALNRNTFSASYVDSQINDGSPNYLGQDEDGDHLWSINVNLTYEFFNRYVYFGVGPTGSSGAAFIEALASREYSGFRYRTFTLVTGAGEKMYYAFPESFADIGTLAFSTPFSLTSTATVNGVLYNLYESDAAALGSVTVNVT